jgi:two-component system, NarL family, invasion response regulator UvrY
VIRFLLVDDHAIVRLGLRQMLTETIAGAVFEEAGSAEEALSQVRTSPFDIVILDISLPGRSGLDVLKEIKQIRPSTPVLILSVYAEEEFAVRTVRAGASGYVTKKMASNELAEAVRRVVGGGLYVTATLAEKLAEELQRGEPESPHERLSDREYQVFHLLGMGKSVKQAAEELSLSVQTISTYRARILQKMGMSSNAELVEYVFQTYLFR